MASLDSLPVELTLRIYEFLDPGSHLDFSLTSKALAHQSKDVLTHHRNCRRRYGSSQTSTDDHTCRELLAELTRDHIAAWHVRELNLSQGSATRPSTDDESLKWHIQIEELFEDRIWATMANRVPGPSESFALATQQARRQLERTKPFDKCLVLLVTLCTNLRTLDLTSTSPKEDELEEQYIDTPVECFGDTFLALSSLDDAAGPQVWPGGLKTLRKVRLHNGHLGFSHKTMRAFFLLPSIATIHLDGMVWHRPLDDQEESRPLFNSPERRTRSNVRHIVFERLWSGYSHDGTSPALEIIRQLIGTAEHLKSLIFRDCKVNNSAAALKGIYSHRPDLETFIVPGDSKLPASGLEGTSWDHLTELQAVRFLSVDVLDMMPAGSRRSHIERMHSEETKTEFLQRFAESIPSTVEVLMLQYRNGQRLIDAEMHKVGDALVHLVGEKRCPKLTAIYADDLEYYMHKQKNAWELPTDGQWLLGAKASLEEMGVPLYTQHDYPATDSFIDSLIIELE